MIISHGCSALPQTKTYYFWVSVHNGWKARKLVWCSTCMLTSWGPHRCAESKEATGVKYFCGCGHNITLIKKSRTWTEVKLTCHTRVHTLQKTPCEGGNLWVHISLGSGLGCFRFLVSWVVFWQVRPTRFQPDLHLGAGSLDFTLPSTRK